MDKFKDMLEDKNKIISIVGIISPPCGNLNNNMYYILYGKKTPLKSNINNILNTKINTINTDTNHNKKYTNYYNKIRDKYKVPTNIYKPEILPSKPQLFDKTINYDLEYKKDHKLKNKKINTTKSKINKTKSKININSILSKVVKNKNLKTHNSRNKNSWLKFKISSRLLTTNNSKKKISFGNKIHPINKSKNNLKKITTKKTYANFSNINNKSIFKTIYTNNHSNYSSNRNSPNSSIHIKNRSFLNSVLKNKSTIHQEKKFIMINSSTHDKINSNDCINKKFNQKYKSIIINPITQKINNNKNKKTMSSEYKYKKIIKIKRLNPETKRNITMNNSLLKKEKLKNISSINKI